MALPSPFICQVLNNCCDFSLLTLHLTTPPYRSILITCKVNVNSHWDYRVHLRLLNIFLETNFHYGIKRINVCQLSVEFTHPNEPSTIGGWLAGDDRSRFPSPDFPSGPPRRSPDRKPEDRKGGKLVYPFSGLTPGGAATDWLWHSLEFSILLKVAVSLQVAVTTPPITFMPTGENHLGFYQGCSHSTLCF